MKHGTIKAIYNENKPDEFYKNGSFKTLSQLLKKLKKINKTKPDNLIVLYTNPPESFWTT